MFETDKLIYLELPKTASTHIISLLNKCTKGRAYDKHCFLKNYEGNKFIIGSMRNPWDWYVSLWAFGCQEKGGFRHALSPIKKRFKTSTFLKKQLDIIFSKGINFKTLKIIKKNIQIRKKNLKRAKHNPWKNLYSDSNNRENFRKWIKLVLDSRKDELPENYPKSPISNFAGFMTYRYCYLHHKNFFKKENYFSLKDLNKLKDFDKKNNLVDFMIKSESVEPDFLLALEKAGYPITDRIKNIVNSSKIDIHSKRINSSKHKPTKYYYDKETADLVYEKEKFLIEKYNYTFPT